MGMKMCQLTAHMTASIVHNNRSPLSPINILLTLVYTVLMVCAALGVIQLIGAVTCVLQFVLGDRDLGINISLRNFLCNSAAAVRPVCC